MHGEHDSEEEVCPYVDVLGVIGGKWRGTIVCCLSEGTRRFNELLADTAPISKKVLTEVLRSLERDGLISRKQFEEIPPRVEYSLTELGLTLVPVYGMIYRWREHMPTVVTHRSQFDGRETG